jgi:hypothetical protein
MPFQPWDLIAKVFDPKAQKAFFLGNALKNLMSMYSQKNKPLEDLDKAIHYLQKLREVEAASKPE